MLFLDDIHGSKKNDAVEMKDVKVQKKKKKTKSFSRRLLSLFCCCFTSSKRNEENTEEGAATEVVSETSFVTVKLNN